ncbi:ABC transporter permease [Pseudomonadales bacterium]|nr:ABC transporter permease [Pseudomonadales bacterium]MDC0174292.1 ABC transporter permease [Pseudomonadales bacterium]
MLWNAFGLALQEIRRNALRSFLTMLGIVIGVAAVVTMITVGDGATLQVSQQIQSLGSNLVMIVPSRRMGPVHGGVGAPAFRRSDIEAIRRDIDGMKAAAPLASSSMTAVVGNSNWLSAVTGTDNAFFTVREWPIDEGRLFSSTELVSGSAVCIIGATVQRELFGAEPALGARLRLGKIACRVIGLLAAKGQSAMGSDQDNLILMPLRTFQRRVSGNQDIGLIQVSASSAESVDALQAGLETLLRERRHIAVNEDDNFTMMSTREIGATLAGTLTILTALLGTVAAVSLLVGGIGIMNIMLVSVTERTREIGIRLAIGALMRDVLLQFLVEAVVLSAIGGLLGIALAILATLVITDMIGVPFVLNLGIILLGFSFATVIGVVFGYFPARRAAHMAPIEALRHE